MSAILNPREEECQRQVKFYHGRFPDVPTMSSRELQAQRVQRQHTMMTTDDDSNALILVDVRTLPEREISMIPGAIGLEDLPGIVEHHQQTTATTTSTKAMNTTAPITIVTYCTIGYRSSMEARRLRDQYPWLRDHIYSLDGVLAYTHSGQPLVTKRVMRDVDVDTNMDMDMDSSANNNSHHSSQAAALAALPPPPPPPPPIAEVPTNQVHAFGTMWKHCANPEYETTLYSFPAILGRLVQVGGLVVLRSTQHATYLLTSCCCKQRRQRQQDDDDDNHDDKNEKVH